MTDQRERYQWEVAPNDAGMRVDRFLAARGALGTRSQVQRLIADGLVRVRDQPVKAGTVLRAGQIVSVERPIPRAPTVEPAPIALDVLYEDAFLLVINKPPGLVVHPAPGHWQDTLVSALLHRWGSTPTGFDRSRLGIVHRLDKDTSGVLIVAKDAATMEALARQFRRREIRKGYLALVWGRVHPERGVIHKPIARHPVHRKRMAVRAQGREAVTRYEVIERFAGATLLRVFPETGRTHQIRVHLSAIGHPIVGDTVYARQRAGVPVALRRQALHAESIGFSHPATGKAIALAAPLPADLAAALAALRLSGLTSTGPSSSVRRNPAIHSVVRHEAARRRGRAHSSCLDRQD